MKKYTSTLPEPKKQEKPLPKHVKGSLIKVPLLELPRYLKKNNLEPNGYLETFEAMIVKGTK